MTGAARFWGAALAASAILSGPAHALSCIPPDVARSYGDAEASVNAYVVVYGMLRFDNGKLPKVDWEHQEQTPPQTVILGRLTGHSLSPEGFVTPFDRAVTLLVECYGPWCGGANADIPYLAFVEKSQGGYRVALSPCGGFDFPEPTDEMLDQAVQCMRGKTCQPAPH